MTVAAVDRPALILRDYQRDALAKSLAARDRGVRRQLGVAATGLGKTVMASSIAREIGGRCLWLAHRDELVSQAAGKLVEVWPEIDVGIVKADSDETHAHVVVASVQTISRTKRLARLVGSETADGMQTWGRKPSEPFSLVVIDEAHHTAADSYRTILEAFPDAVHLGVTATPDRGDGKGLDDLFDEIVWNYDILWGIRSGFLSDVRALTVRVADLDMSGVKVTRGDYAQGQTGEAMKDAGAPEWIVKAWRTHASDRRTLVFTPTVEVASLTAAEFRRVGVNAAVVSAETPLDERRQILRDYAAGRIQVLANCAVLTEGFDDPRTDCVVMARPTKNRALFTQCIGRGTRRHPEKADLLVLDVVGASDNLSLVTVPSLFGIEQKYGDELRDASATLTDVAQRFDDEKVRTGRMKAEEADLFRTIRGGGIAWVPTHHDGKPRRFARSLPSPQPTVMLLERGDREMWRTQLTHPDGTFRILIADVDLETAQAVGEDAVRKLTKDSGAKLVAVDAAWRKKKPSAKQITFAKKIGVDGYKEIGTAGDLSDAIDVRLQQRRKGGKRDDYSRSSES